MKRSLVVAVFALIACGSKKSSPPPEETKETKESTTKKEAPAVAAPAPTPFAMKTLEVRTGTPFTLKKGGLKPLPTTGERPQVDDAHQAETAVIIAFTKPNGEATSWALVELATGKTLATFVSLYETAHRAKKAVVDAKANTMAVLDLTSGALHIPTVELAGTTVAETRIIVDDRKDIVWVFAKGADGKGYVGRWSDFAAPVKPVALPFWPTMIASKPSVVAWSEEHRETCPRVLISDGAAPTCAPDGEIGFGVLSGDAVLANRYWFVTDNVTLVHDQKTGTRTPLIEGCSASMTAMLIDPPRVLSTCQTEDGKNKLSLWSPEKTWTGSQGGEHHGLSLEGGPLERPVVVPASMFGNQPPYWGFLDLETGTMFDTPPLVPLTYAGYGGLARRFVARGEKDPKELWWVDLEAATLEKIATDVTCADELQLMNLPGASGDRVLIRCVEETGTGPKRKPGSWSEIIDAKARTRTRIDDFAADYLWQDGRAIGITLTGPRRVALLAR